MIGPILRSLSSTCTYQQMKSANARAVGKPTRWRAERYSGLREPPGIIRAR
jgi:hypothetical protein